MFDLSSDLVPLSSSSSEPYIYDGIVEGPEFLIPIMMDGQMEYRDPSLYTYDVRFNNHPLGGYCPGVNYSNFHNGFVDGVYTSSLVRGVVAPYYDWDTDFYDYSSDVTVKSDDADTD
jgi:hypothetical protein